MAGFPLTDPSQFPLALDDVLRIMGERGHLQHLSIAQTSSGEWQASCKRPGFNSYSVSIKADIMQAVLGALSPDFGHDWTELLGDEYAEMFAGLENPPVEDDEDDDDLEDVL